MAVAVPTPSPSLHLETKGIHVTYSAWNRRRKKRSKSTTTETTYGALTKFSQLQPKAARTCTCIFFIFKSRITSLVLRTYPIANEESGTWIFSIFMLNC